MILTQRYSVLLSRLFISTLYNYCIACQVTPFESMFTKTGGRAGNIPLSKHDSDSSNDFKKYWMPDDQCKVSVFKVLIIVCFFFTL